MRYTKTTKITSASEQTILTVPEGFVARVEYVFICNNSNDDVNVDLYIHEQHPTPSGCKVYLMNETELKTKEHSEFANVDFIIEYGDTVKIDLADAREVVVAITLELSEAPFVFHNFK